ASSSSIFLLGAQARQPKTKISVRKRHLVLRRSGMSAFGTWRTWAREVESTASKTMRTYFTCAALGFALMVGAPLANAQSQVTSPYENFGVPPSGTLLGPMPMVPVSTGVLPPTQIVRTVQTAPAVRPAVRHQVVASHRTTAHRVAAAASSRPLYNYVRPAPTTVQRVVALVVVTQASAAAPGQVLNLSGQFLCVQGCAGGQPSRTFPNVCF